MQRDHMCITAVFGKNARIQTSEDIESGGKKPCVCESI